MLPLTSICGQLLFFLFLVNTLASGLAFLDSVVVWVLRTVAMFQVPLPFDDPRVPCLTPSQRLREAIDSRIAEEQARQKSAQDNIERSNSARRPPGRNQSPSRRSRPRRNTSTPVRGPDPKEFEAEFTIGDDDESSRSGTPQTDTPETASEVSASKGEGEMVDGKPAETPEKEMGQETETKETPPVLPPDVRAKLRRLDKLESRYQGMHLPNQTIGR
jgi:hypothetical protein